MLLVVKMNAVSKQESKEFLKNSCSREVQDGKRDEKKLY